MVTASVDWGNSKKTPKPAGVMMHATIVQGAQSLEEIFHEVSISNQCEDRAIRKVLRIKGH